MKATGERQRLRHTLGHMRRRHLTFRGWLRAAVDRHVLRYDSEHCHACGRRVNLVWWSPDELWPRLTGHTDGAGLRCVRCFDNAARRAGILLTWKPEVNP